MERIVKSVALILSAALSAGAVGWSVSFAAADRALAPVDRRVTTLEAQRAEDVRRLDEIRNDVKDILREMRR